MYFRRGLELFFRRLGSRPHVAGGAGPASDATTPATGPSSRTYLPYGAGTLGHALGRNFVAQDLIRRRSGYRWLMHLCLSGGCTLAFAITFPLVFGWVHFESLATNAEVYRVIVFGMELDRFSIHSPKAFVAFNALNLSGLLVLIGLALAGWRRLTDPGERATQTFSEDILPLILILAVTATGLALTVSYHFLAGHGHRLWAIIHMVSVVTLLIYIPFGKLFHMFQRTCALCVSRYKRAGETGPRAHCRRCAADYASQMHVADLKIVLDELGFNYRYADGRGEVHYQDICPSCRRGLLALNQGRTIDR
jgi:NNP family nitrate/nitrite transporter-like MFS transporter